MAFKYLSNIPLDEARSQFLSVLKAEGLTSETEIIKTVDANHRVAATAVYAHISAPHYNSCAMDGIALNASLTFGATDTRPVTLQQDQFHWVNTGDPLPTKCDAVVMVEDVIEGEGGEIQLFIAAVPWQHIRQIGEDIAQGDMIFPSYTEITPAIQGAMLAAGALELEVIKKPVVAVIPSGNELVFPQEKPGEGDIIEFNSTIIKGMLEDWGCEPVVYPIVRDEPGLVIEALRKAATECDFVLLNAGSSAGTKDFSVGAVAEIGEVILHGVAIRPGKPVVLGIAKRGPKVIPLVGLPGYPVSAILVMEELVRPAINLLLKKSGEEKALTEATVSRRLTSSLKYLEFIRARIGNVNGKLVAVPLNRGAGVVSSIVKADGIIEVPQNAEGFEAGEKVPVSLVRKMENINRTLIITGSHDPLIDELIDLMKIKWPDSQVASSHVGSLGGLMALKRGESHLGGTHLMDEETGEYNRSYVKRYFPDGGVTLISAVFRSQGLIIARDNPLGVESIADLTRAEYVNRQKGSGTRILLDYMLEKNGLEPNKIKGYEREEITHTAVAAAVASGTADAGMGILAAAKIYDLGFIPLIWEQYDLLVGEKTLEHPEFIHLLEVLKSAEFAQRLEKLGGYQLNNPGEVIL
ncbi:MAG: molybdopterin biosynthesis protein [Chloroflexi bacterium]|nr:molybdopterin biosynthesis protein [Chloroflexota bacterium]